jgi:phosphoacetylglucosamine mutase
MGHISGPFTHGRDAWHQFVFAGEMLAMDWEAHATLLAAAATTEQCIQCIASIVAAEKIEMHSGAIVFVGQDTRPSSPLLAEAAAAGVVALGAEVRSVGVCTTPALHFAVWLQNDGWQDAYHARLYRAMQHLTEGAMLTCCVQ